MQGDFDKKVTLLNEWESSVKDDITKKFSDLRSKMDIMKTSLEEEQKEKQLALAAQLEEEIQKHKTLNYSLSKEREELREERVSFERQWELLDDKRNTLNEDREKLEKEFQTKEENLNMRFQGVSRRFEELLKNLEKVLQELGRTTEERQESEEIAIKSLRASLSLVQKRSDLFNLSLGERVEETRVSEGVNKANNETSEGKAISENVEGQQSQKTSQKKRQRRAKSVKRTHSVMETLVEEIETYSESASLGGRRHKRKKTVGPMGQTPREKRYNLRHSAMVKARVKDHLTNQERGDA